jgi:hypothetical protein
MRSYGYILRAAPEVLFIGINRAMERKKSLTKVKFGDTLDLSAYYHGAEELKYQLVACTHHVGGSGESASGHYITFAKNPNGDWYEANDETVDKLDSTNEYKVFNNHDNGKNSFYTSVALYYVRTRSGTQALPGNQATLGIQYNALDSKCSFPTEQQTELAKLYKAMRRALDAGVLPW